MQSLNHYSAPVVGVLIFLIVFSAVRRKRQWFIPAGVMCAYIAACLALRPVARPAMLVAGKPSLLEVQSPFCLGCVAVKPAVDRLEDELHDKLAVRRVDIQSAEGRQLARQYGIEFTPTFLFFDAAGKERWRWTGRLDAEAVRDAIR
jgi:thiol-disulfide isomerase/thioredoxin